jgi:hypothetical protein
VCTLRKEKIFIFIEVKELKSPHLSHTFWLHYFWSSKWTELLLKVYFVYNCRFSTKIKITTHWTTNCIYVYSVIVCKLIGPSDWRVTQSITGKPSFSRAINQVVITADWPTCSYFDAGGESYNLSDAPVTVTKLDQSITKSNFMECILLCVTITREFLFTPPQQC